MEELRTEIHLNQGEGRKTDEFGECEQTKNSIRQRKGEDRNIGGRDRFQ